MATILHAGTDHIPKAFLPFEHNYCGSRIQFKNADIRSEGFSGHRYVVCPVCEQRISTGDLERDTKPEREEEDY